MGIKGVLNNILKEGFSGTYKIFQERKAKEEAKKKALEDERRLQEELQRKKNEELKEFQCKNEEALEELRVLFEDLNDAVPEKHLSDIVRRVRELLLIIDHDAYAEEMIEIKDLMEEKETTSYKNVIKSYYVKEVIPTTYNKYCTQPVEKNKILFMQPSQGFTLALRYTHNKLKKECPHYELQFYELFMGKIPSSLAYRNAELFFKDMAIAKTVFLHTSNNLMGYFKVREETKVIQLWHGCGLLKKVGLIAAEKPDFEDLKKRKEFPSDRNYSLVTAASPEQCLSLEASMGIDRSEGIIQPIGVSRTDVFFDKEDIARSYLKLYQKIPKAKEKKVILYAPTFRGLFPKRVAPRALDIEKLSALSDEYILIIKQHQSAGEIPEIPEEYRDDFAYDMTRGKGMNINELMTVADICISDYSSVVFEYSLFERPMLFFAFDLEEYTKHRGYDDYEDRTPGPVLKTNEQIVDYVKNIETWFDKSVVTDFKDKNMCSCDGNSTKRIIEYLENGTVELPALAQESISRLPFMRS